jgi:hypothetical protein
MTPPPPSGGLPLPLTDIKVRKAKHGKKPVKMADVPNAER